MTTTVVAAWDGLAPRKADGLVMVGGQHRLQATQDRMPWKSEGVTFNPVMEGITLAIQRHTIERELNAHGVHRSRVSTGGSHGSRCRVPAADVGATDVRLSFRDDALQVGQAPAAVSIGPRRAAPSARADNAPRRRNRPADETDAPFSAVWTLGAV
ncbi:hypothetical protein EVAR_85846_1 [Eumeta japonica]|uniref:Uncharacterized protein n=1 Tax=Eumeta variegata TaxID=151549 RepID=A0A4C1URK3_EUMVA|nr:hypothetical protein EVAR_85846_1 [Eumeta japonica]